MEIGEFQTYAVADFKNPIPNDIGVGICQNIEITIESWG